MDLLILKNILKWSSWYVVPDAKKYLYPGHHNLTVFCFTMQCRTKRNLLKKKKKKINKKRQKNEPNKQTNNKCKQNSGQKYSAYRNILKKH